MDISSLKVPGAVAFGGGLITGIVANNLLNKMSARSSNVIKTPDKWVRVGTISQLIIYPVKAMPGVYVNKAKVTQLGLAQAGTNNKQNSFFRHFFIIICMNETYSTRRNA
jgi:hypothetical protein